MDGAAFANGVGTPAEMPSEGLFTAGTEEEAVRQLKSLEKYEEAEAEGFSGPDAIAYNTLILSLGGSSRGKVATSRNTVVDVVEGVGSRRWGVSNDTDYTPVIVVSAEEMDEVGIRHSLGREFAPYFLHVALPMTTQVVIPPPIMKIERAAAIEATTVNSLAEMGKAAAEGSVLIGALTSIFKVCERIVVHNDLWLDGFPFQCDNIFLDRTPCILYALKQAVDMGTTVIFVDLGLTTHRCSRGFPYEYDVGTKKATWTRDRDIRLVDRITPSPARAGKRRSRKTRRRTRRSHVRTKV
jgi:hypothetical protein